KIPKIKIGQEYISKYPNNPNPYAVYCIYTDSKENIWFGTATLGAFRFNGKSFDWINEDDVTELNDGPANGVRSIIEDKNGDFWFNSAYRYTIYDTNSMFNNQQDKSTFYNRIESIGSLDGDKNNNFTEYLSIAKDNNNDLWFVTYYDGIWKYDGIKITHYPVHINSKNITLFSIYNDNKGNLWLRTHEHGLLKLNGETFEQFNI
ncbi:MAG: two-component regulator propeller domain-containing protein, partial [Cyclobacteriaceae bacterium]